MRIIEMTVTLNRKVNMGNYESIDHFISAKCEIQDGTYTELIASYQKMVGVLGCEMDNWIDKVKHPVNKEGK